MVRFRKHKSDSCHFPFGVCICQDGFHVKCISEKETVSILFYRRNEKAYFEKIDLDSDDRMGNVFSTFLSVETLDKSTLADALSEVEYHFSDGKQNYPDPFGKSFSGRDTWGKVDQVYNIRRSPIILPEFDWEGDRCLHYPLTDNVFYRMHARGFTKSPSSKAVQKGTFYGITEKKAYLQELGINALILMPIQEFEEVILPQNQIQGPFGEVTPTGKLNYWGYTKAFHFAPKATYSMRKHREIVQECKSMIKEMHKVGIEVFLEFYFDGSQTTEYPVHVLRYWVSEFHIDGALLSGHYYLPAIAQDPYLADTKILTEYDHLPFHKKNMAVFQKNFMDDMRKILKGDEGMLNALMHHLRSNPKHAKNVHYMADIKTMSMMDMVSFDIKHNEANGEGNLDGTDYNYSWNCGVEGPTKKKKITDLRMKQQKNAFLLTFLSQGSPMIAMGDELGQSRGGNNNAYCQDNEISWLNWKLVKKDNRLLEFVKFLIRFRKSHPTFRAKEEPKLLDVLGIGKPDMSFHGVNVWQPNTEYYRRQLGVLYCGRYFLHEDVTADNDFYLIFNMHWEDYGFALPMPDKKQGWYKVVDTGDGDKDFFDSGEEILLHNQRNISVKARSVVVLISKPV